MARRMAARNFSRSSTWPLTSFAASTTQRPVLYITAWKYAGVCPSFASASRMKAWFAALCSVGLQISAPVTPSASSPMVRSTCSSIITPEPISGTRGPCSRYCLT